MPGLALGNATTSGLLIAFGVSALVNHLALKWTASLGVGTGQALLFRGIVCGILVIVVGRLRNESFRPSRPALQAVRMVTAGAALAAFTASYQYLSATSVALMTRMDLPVLLLAGSFLTSKGHLRERLLPAATLGVVAVFLFQTQGLDTFAGYLFAAAGVLSVTLGYVFLKRSAESESPAVVTITPAFSCILIGSAIAALSSTPLLMDFACNVGLALSGIMMFFMYRLSSTIYQRVTVVEAQLPSLVLPAFTLPMEAWAFGQIFTPDYALVVLTAVGLMMAAFFVKIKGEENGKKISAGDC